MGNLALAVACVLVLIHLPLFKKRGYGQLCFLTTNVGFLFWYWFPALYVLNAPADSTGVNFSQNAMVAGSWIVLAYHATALFFLVSFRRTFVVDVPRQAEYIALRSLSALVLLSSVALLIVRFASEGPALVFNLLVGLASAREYMSFLNRSESVAASLLALVEIANIWAALFLIASHVLRARLLTPSGVMAILALVISFLGSGTRSILLMGIFVVLAGTLSRHGPMDAVISKRVMRRASTYWYGLFALAVILAVGLGVSARFETGSDAANGSFLIDTVLTNNDMFRELLFIESELTDYSSVDVVNFLLTPFAFMLPSFLGFEREIPDHLLNFNYMRAGIDLTLDQGNVFPGIVADFQMVFGTFGPMWFGVFLVVFFYAAKAASMFLPYASVRLAFQITFLSYLLISFRNISGALVLVLTLGVVLITLAIRPARFLRLFKVPAENARSS